MKKKIAIVIPLYNEEEIIETLVENLYPVLNESFNEDYEVIFIDDGSKDSTVTKLKSFNLKNTKLVILSKNFGQHAAIIAGFKSVNADAVITIDADLQNPPSEIPKLYSYFLKGYDLVASKRKERIDNFFRKYVSKLMNIFNAKIIGTKQTDLGSMLRLYSKEIVDNLVENSNPDIFIPAAASTYADNIIEIEVEHNDRIGGESKYNIFNLARLEFNIYTGFSKSPMILLIILGVIISSLSISFAVFLLIMRFIMGAAWAAQGVFTLFAILFFFIGTQFLAFGLIGEYLGRIYKRLNKNIIFKIKKIEEFK